jgi:hypothetical protein
LGKILNYEIHHSTPFPIRTNFLRTNFIGAIRICTGPFSIYYQGIARDDKGNPLSHQAMQIKLSILPSMEALVPEYEETQWITTNEFGLYTLQIGKGQALHGDMKLVSWDKGNKYIQVAIDPKGGDNFVTMALRNYCLCLMPCMPIKQAVLRKQPLPPVRPIILLKKPMDRASPIQPHYCLIMAPNIGIGTTTPSAKFQITQTVG